MKHHRVIDGNHVTAKCIADALFPLQNFCTRKRHAWHCMFCLKDISVAALMMQSYLVTEDDNKRLNANHEVFEWLVSALDGAIREKCWHGFVVMEVIKVSRNSTSINCRFDASHATNPEQLESLQQLHSMS